MEGASTEKIIEVTDKCPTQAIYWKYNKDLTPEEKAGNEKREGDKEEVNPETLHEEKQDSPEASLQVMPGGPILVEGDFKAIGENGEELKTMVMTSFCRCGHSNSQPFCDGTHRVIGFQDE